MAGQRLTGQHLAYITYTSGSTGRPKGIAVPHGAVVRLVLGTDYAQLGPGDRTAQVAPLSFDAATFEIWAPLLTGGSVAVVPREVSLSPARLGAALRDERVTAMFLTASLFHEVAREAPESFATLRHVLFGGEAADPRWVNRVRERGAPERLLNGYGPTESTTFSAWYRVEAPQERTVPIGRPLANTSLYVVDRALDAVPLGAVGELCIGGDGLARGYWRRPGRTAERFVPHPCGPPGQRLYRTGDLVRQRPDGNIEFLGRVDSQVKIRGFRIEPGEIEAALGQHPRVGGAAVLVREDGAGGKSLIAYLSPAAAAAPRPDAEEIRAFLRSKLPAYMVPAFVVVLDRMPLSANGKVDRAALPAPDLSARVDRDFVAPRNEIEREVAGLWAALLGLPRIGVHDDFFALGGHSLLATQAVSRASRKLGLELPVALLLDNPTISGFVTALVARQARQADEARVAELLEMLEILPEEEIERWLAESR